jgi:ribosomal protein S18 acetylase RimI-like enzyme
MLGASIVSTENELLQIHDLNQRNLKQNLDEEIRKKEGFVTWLYSVELLKKMHQLSPSIIIKDAEKVAAYALTTLKDAQTFHPDLENMFRNLAKVRYRNRLLYFYNFYCMGQICVDHEYRSMGLVHMLYQKHKEVYSSQYDFILTEISADNIRSLKAHEKIGFQKIYSYKDSVDVWHVVAWEWD